MDAAVLTRCDEMRCNVMCAPVVPMDGEGLVFSKGLNKNVAVVFLLIVPAVLP